MTAQDARTAGEAVARPLVQQARRGAECGKALRGAAMRRFMAGYRSVVLAGYVVAVEVAEALRWLDADEAAFARALKYWTARPFHCAVYLLLSYLGLSLGFFLGGLLEVLIGAVLAVALFLRGQIALRWVHKIHSSA
jgi:hypothetical protein